MKALFSETGDKESSSSLLVCHSKWDGARSAGAADLSEQRIERLHYFCFL